MKIAEIREIAKLPTNWQKEFRLKLPITIKWF